MEGFFHLRREINEIESDTPVHAHSLTSYHIGHVASMYLNKDYNSITVRGIHEIVVNIFIVIREVSISHVYSVFCNATASQDVTTTRL